jgi:hypothetical protein
MVEKKSEILLSLWNEGHLKSTLQSKHSCEGCGKIIISIFTNVIKMEQKWYSLRFPFKFVSSITSLRYIGCEIHNVKFILLIIPWFHLQHNPSLMKKNSNETFLLSPISSNIFKGISTSIKIL